MVSSEKKFCCFPWTDPYLDPTGNYAVCCQIDHATNRDTINVTQPFESFWNSPYVKQVRQAFMQGSPLPQCRACWADEDRGKISMRQRRNERHLGRLDPEHTDDDVQALLSRTMDDGHFHGQPLAFMIAVGDTCQLRCVHCSPTYSRAIVKDYEKLGWAQNFKNRRDADVFQIKLDQKTMDQHVYAMIEPYLPGIQWLQITGGEFSMNRHTLRFFQHCVDTGHAAHIKLLLTSNAVNIKPDLLRVLESFQFVMFNLSVDGHGELDEYIRWPTSWRKKESIIREVVDRFPESFIAATVMSLNVNMLEPLIDWIMVNDYKSSFNSLQQPENLSIKHIPQASREHAIGYLESLIRMLDSQPARTTDLYDRRSHLSHTLQGIVTYLKTTEQDPAIWQQCQNVIRSYDSIRSKPLHRINPWLNY